MRGIETTVRANDICLLTASDVDSLILSSFPTLLKTDIKRVDKKAIRKMLMNHPYVADADVSMSTGGKLHVEVTQRIPLVRVFYQDNEFYISEQGTIMPLCANHFCDVMVANMVAPHVPCGTSKELDAFSVDVTKASQSVKGDSASNSKPITLNSHLSTIWCLARFIHDNPIYDGVFDQLTIDAKGDLVLTPKLGNTTVVVGDTTHLAEKFENLWAFYDQGVKKMGWDTYKTINLKYNNQLVCTKK